MEPTNIKEQLDNLSSEDLLRLISMCMHIITNRFADKKVEIKDID